MPNVCVYFVNNIFTLSNNKTETKTKMSLCSVAYLPKIRKLTKENMMHFTKIFYFLIN